VVVKNLEESFCRDSWYSESEFPERVFWRCLYLRAVPFAPLILLCNRNYFSFDFGMIGQTGNATSVSQFWEEIDHSFVGPGNQLKGRPIMLSSALWGVPHGCLIKELHKVC